MNNIKKISPWAWVPTLYFAQGIPYFIVNNISVLMFAKMGVPNGDMALFTSLLYLPWTIKPFWSPFVDIIKTKRWWVVSMQILMSIAFILLTLTIPRPDEATMAAGTTPISMFTITLVLFIITAFASATHDIAADGFYMLALKSGEQAEFVGIRSTFYRLASIFGQGVLVAIAGAIELKYDNIPLSWTITMLVTAVMFSAVSFYHLFAIPKPASDKSVLAVCQPENLFAISTAIAIEQFGYGFGFTAYMLYMMYFSEGEFKTSHYAICTAFMALSMMIPGMFAGYIQEAIGYINFFWMVIICCVATVIVTIFADRRIDPEYGKK